jgi:TATA-box binding protein (TBP) (component of TFIID and TFIIIB)
MQKNIKLQKKFRIFFDLKHLPNDLYISTTTLTCNLPAMFNAINIYKYMDLKFDNIVTVKFGNDGEYIRSLINIKKKKRKIVATKKKNFFNQVTIVIQLSKDKFINIKLFKNGALQLTGCKNIDHFVSAINILSENLKIKRAVYDKIKKKIIYRPYVSNIDKVNIANIFNFRIRMINSNFYVGFKIDREKLYSILKKDDIECTNDTCSHACVNIKHSICSDRKTSIFVFESGSIIITGAQCRDDILRTYKFINNKLYKNWNDIIKLENLESFLETPEFQQIVKDYYNLKNISKIH